jgi:hypothetical protein
VSHSSEGAAPAEPARYELRVQEVLDAAGKPGARACASAATSPANARTIAGPVTDQAALTSPVTVWIDLGNAAPYSGGRVLLARRCSRRELDLLLTTAPRGSHGRPWDPRQRADVGQPLVACSQAVMIPQRGSARGCQGSYTLCRRPACPGRHRRTPPHRLLRWSFWRSFHQALLQPTRPHWAESRPNLSCLDPTGT